MLLEYKPPNKMKGKTINGAMDWATISLSKLAEMKYPNDAAVKLTSSIAT